MTTSTDDIREKIYEAVDGWRFEQEWLASKAKDFPEHKGAGCGCLACQKMDGLNTQATDYIMSLITAYGIEQRIDELQNLRQDWHSLGTVHKEIDDRIASLKSQEGVK